MQPDWLYVFLIPNKKTKKNIAYEKNINHKYIYIYW